MSKLGHGRLATLHDLDTVMPKHAVTYVITRLEKQVKYYISTGTKERCIS